MLAHGSGKYQVQVSVKHGAIQSHMVQIVVQYDAHQVTRSGTLWLAWPGPVLPGLVSVIAVLRVRGEGWPPCYCATSLPHPHQPLIIIIHVPHSHLYVYTSCSDGL